MRTKITVESALNAKLDDRLGYERHEKANANNSRNCFTYKTLQTEEGRFELETPRDRYNDFETDLVRKNQPRFSSMDD